VPRSFTLNSNEILEALQEPLTVSSRRQGRSRTDAARTGADVAERAYADGGGALLRDVDKLLMEETGLPVVVRKIPSPACAWRRTHARTYRRARPALFNLE